jgi:hypothetical protein
LRFPENGVGVGSLIIISNCYTIFAMSFMQLRGLAAFGGTSPIGLIPESFMKINEKFD